MNYVYNEKGSGNVATRDLAHVTSLHLRFDSGSWGVRMELSGAIGYARQSDLIGPTLMRFYDINRTFQLVGQYTYLYSFSAKGIRFGRYESRIEGGREDQYNEIFTGLSWFLYGHKFKLQTGFKYTWTDDAAHDGGSYRGWGWTTGLRMSW